MMARAWTFASLALIALLAGGCQTAAPPPVGGSDGGVRSLGVKDCQSLPPNAPCNVDVSVFCANNQALPCIVVVSDSVITLRPGPGTKKIVWTNLTAGYEFTDITIDTGAFDCPDHQGQTWQCLFKKDPPSVPAQYKYTIRMRATSGFRTVDPLDPWVVTN